LAEAKEKAPGFGMFVVFFFLDEKMRTGITTVQARECREERTCGFADVGGILGGGGAFAIGVTAGGSKWACV